MPTMLLVAFAASLVVAVSLTHYSTQRLMAERQVQEYRRHHDMLGGKAILEHWVSLRQAVDLKNLISAQSPAHRFVLPGGRRIQVYILGAQGLAKSDLSAEVPEQRQAFEMLLSRLPEGRIDLVRVMGPPQVDINAAPREVLEAIFEPSGSSIAAEIIQRRESGEPLTHAEMREVLERFEYDNGQIAETMKLLTYEPQFYRLLIEAEDPSGIRVFSAYAEFTGVRRTRRPLLDWRELGTDEIARLRESTGFVGGPETIVEETRGGFSGRGQ